MTTVAVVLPLALILAIVYACLAVKVVQQYERGIFPFGRVQDAVRHPVWP